MKKLFILAILGVLFHFGSYALTPISGSLNICLGNTTYLMDSTSPGGTWASSNPSVASISSTLPGGYADVVGVAVGTATITYTLSGVSVTAVVTVNPAPTPITGSATVCAGSFTTLADAVAGGTWSSSSVAIATVGIASGVVGGVSSGVATIFYMLPTGCYVSRAVTVNLFSVGAITGTSTVCIGSTTALTDATPGGVWSSGSTAIATVNTTGTVTGVSAGVATISYTVSGACGPVTAVFNVTVSSGPSVDTISGASTVPVGSSTSYYDATAGGTWSSSTPSIATVGATGVVYGVAVGTSVISYAVTTACGTGVATKTITVTAVVIPNIISGVANFGSGAPDSTTMIRFYLITYNPTTHLLAAIDSYTTYGGSTSAYYQFLGEPTDSYRVKAAVYPATFSPTGYQPTYHTSSNYWGTANVLYHTGGADYGVDITMGYGAVTAGPGFIGGDVTMGANKGTSTSVPAVGMLVYLRSSTGAIEQFTYTNSTGGYSFSGLPVGTYSVYPEDLNYATTPYAGINITSAAATISNVDFTQHTVSMTITPSNESVTNTASQDNYVTAFPNPTSGTVTILWNVKASEKGTITLSDITGREVYKSSISLATGSGSKQIDLSNLTNGIYVLSVTSGSVNYTAKVQVQH